MEEKNIGMNINEELNNTDGEPTPLAGSDFAISWLGNAGSSNSTTVETTFSGSKLTAQVVLTGTAIGSTPCKITYTPINCQLASGQSSVSVDIYNLGITVFSDITPAASYKGQTVKFAVSMSATSGAVIYASGSIG